MWTLFLMFYAASLMYTWMKLVEVDKNLDKFKSEIGEWWWVGLLITSPAVLGKKMGKAAYKAFTTRFDI